MRTLKDFGYDGYKALLAILTSSEYRNYLQAIASLTLFTHPKTVKTTHNRPIFRISRKGYQRGKSDDKERIIYDDNHAAHFVFNTANGLKRLTGKIDMQLNHVYENSANKVEYHTNLANLCATPTFLAKLTDRDNDVQSIIKYRAFDLYDWFIDKKPPKPKAYDSLRWSEPIEPIGDIEAVFRKRLIGCKGWEASSAMKYGWYFSDWKPDKSLSPKEYSK